MVTTSSTPPPPPPPPTTTTSPPVTSIQFPTAPTYTTWGLAVVSLPLSTWWRSQNSQPDTTWTWWHLHHHHHHHQHHQHQYHHQQQQHQHRQHLHHRHHHHQYLHYHRQWQHQLTRTQAVQWCLCQLMENLARHSKHMVTTTSYRVPTDFPWQNSRTFSGLFQDQIRVFKDLDVI